jgi:acyl-CoA synthetase (AMP-forming)/AMP-acid ligase II
MYTFAQPLGRALRTAAGSSAVVYQDNRRTYAELGARCSRLAGAMRKPGLAPHDPELAVDLIEREAVTHTLLVPTIPQRHVTSDELAAHCRKRIARFKVPRHIEVRTEPLPKSAAGKILKRDLRAPHWAGQQAQVSGG